MGMEILMMEAPEIDSVLGWIGEGGGAKADTGELPFECFPRNLDFWPWFCWIKVNDLPGGFEFRMGSTSIFLVAFPLVI
jgi:hypothetical protein